ncbi:hypothetical protein SPI_07033 [Niveomyces insectorum RCEF 264]|uniref:Uncharacterized protein n=1 Tax=Niveomyces insectorum RCEF 264 TaxID=1081102 RepID=A0A167Q7K6_9HYPO|nr:hypothetical protein SPI_07033 [Niveomyces insectorum RCEF 264]
MLLAIGVLALVVRLCLFSFPEWRRGLHCFWSTTVAFAFLPRLFLFVPASLLFVPRGAWFGSLLTCRHALYVVAFYGLYCFLRQGTGFALTFVEDVELFFGDLCQAPVETVVDTFIDAFYQALFNGVCAVLSAVLRFFAFVAWCDNALAERAMALEAFVLKHRVALQAAVVLLCLVGGACYLGEKKRAAAVAARRAAYDALLATVEQRAALKASGQRNDRRFSRRATTKPASRETSLADLDEQKPAAREDVEATRPATTEAPPSLASERLEQQSFTYWVRVAEGEIASTSTVPWLCRTEARDSISHPVRKEEDGPVAARVRAPCPMPPWIARLRLQNPPRKPFWPKRWMTLEQQMELLTLSAPVDSADPPATTTISSKPPVSCFSLPASDRAASHSSHDDAHLSSTDVAASSQQQRPGKQSHAPQPKKVRFALEDSQDLSPSPPPPPPLQPIVIRQEKTKGTENKKPESFTSPPVLEKPSSHLQQARVSPLKRDLPPGPNDSRHTMETDDKGKSAVHDVVGAFSVFPQQPLQRRAFPPPIVLPLPPPRFSEQAPALVVPSASTVLPEPSTPSSALHLTPQLPTSRKWPMHYLPRRRDRPFRKGRSSQQTQPQGLNMEVLGEWLRRELQKKPAAGQTSPEKMPNIAAPEPMEELVEQDHCPAPQMKTRLSEESPAAPIVEQGVVPSRKSTLPPIGHSPIPAPAATSAPVALAPAGGDEAMDDFPMAQPEVVDPTATTSRGVVFDMVMRGADSSTAPEAPADRPMEDAPCEDGLPLSGGSTWPEPCTAADVPMAEPVRELAPGELEDLEVLMARLSLSDAAAELPRMSGVDTVAQTQREDALDIEVDLQLDAGNLLSAEELLSLPLDAIDRRLAAQSQPQTEDGQSFAADDLFMAETWVPPADPRNSVEELAPAEEAMMAEAPVAPVPVTVSATQDRATTPPVLVTTPEMPSPVSAALDLLFLANSAVETPPATGTTHTAPLVSSPPPPPPASPPRQLSPPLAPARLPPPPATPAPPPLPLRASRQRSFLAEIARPKRSPGMTSNTTGASRASDPSSPAASAEQRALPSFTSMPRMVPLSASTGSSALFVVPATPSSSSLPTAPAWSSPAPAASPSVESPKTDKTRWRSSIAPIGSSPSSSRAARDSPPLALPSLPMLPTIPLPDTSNGGSATAPTAEEKGKGKEVAVDTPSERAVETAEEKKPDLERESGGAWQFPQLPENYGFSANSATPTVVPSARKIAQPRAKTSSGIGSSSSMPDTFGADASAGPSGSAVVEAPVPAAASGDDVPLFAPIPPDVQAAAILMAARLARASNDHSAADAADDDDDDGYPLFAPMPPEIEEAARRAGEPRDSDSGSPPPSPVISHHSSEGEFNPLSIAWL